MSFWNGVETTDALAAGQVINECACCFPCGKSCSVAGAATITIVYSPDPEDGDPYTMSATTTNSSFEVTWTCCPSANPPLEGYENVTDIAFAGITYPATGSCLDAPDLGDGRRICGVDIGYFSGIETARVVYRDPGGTFINCPEVDADVLLGVEPKVYKYESETFNVTVSVTQFGEVIEGTCEDAGESCGEVPPPPGPEPVYCFDSLGNPVDCYGGEAVECYDFEYYLVDCWTPP
jgi:hypothetical protein